MVKAEITFKPLDEEHLEWARLLHNDPEVISMLTDPHVVSKEEQKRWFANLQKSNSSERALVFWGKEVIGLVRLDQIDYYNKSVCVGLDIHKDFRGKGLAKLVYRKMFKRWFEGEGFNRVWLMVAMYNLRAQNLYKKLGFKEEGIQREALFKNGKFYSYSMMSVLRREYNDYPAL